MIRKSLFVVAILGTAVLVACASESEGVPSGDDDGTSKTTSPDGGGGSSGENGDDDAGSRAANGGCGTAKPGPDNTGVPKGTVLVPSKSIKVEKDGTILEDLDVDGAIEVVANNVTIRRVRIRSNDYYPIRYFENTGLVVEDSEIEGLSGEVTAAISFANYTARRLNVHGSADGFKADANVLIEDCWVHDLSNGEGEHNDAVQSTGGKGVTVRHCSLSGASNAAFQGGDEGAAIEDLTIECSWLSGGGWTLNIRGEGDTKPRNTRIVDNRFGRDHGYGPITIDDPNPTIRGNVYDDDGTPIPE